MYWFGACVIGENIAISKQYLSLQRSFSFSCMLKFPLYWVLYDEDLHPYAFLLIIPDVLVYLRYCSLLLLFCQQSKLIEWNFTTIYVYILTLFTLCTTDDTIWYWVDDVWADVAVDCFIEFKVLNLVASLLYVSFCLVSYVILYST